MRPDKTVREWLRELEPHMIAAAKAGSRGAQRDLKFYNSIAHYTLGWLSPGQMVWLVDLRDRGIAYLAKQELIKKVAEEHKAAERKKEERRQTSPVFFGNTSKKVKVKMYGGFYPSVVREALL